MDQNQIGAAREYEELQKRPAFSEANIRPPNKKASERSITRSLEACDILKQHHEILKDDPDRLTTDFIISLSNINEDRKKESSGDIGMNVIKPKDSDRKNISVHMDTYDRLASYGSMNDSFSDVLDSIIDYAESKGMTRDTLSAFRKSKRKTLP